MNLQNFPYYAVIFTALKKENFSKLAYEKTALEMRNLAENQKGFLAFESASEKLEISISYWSDLNAIHEWKNNMEHLAAQKKGKNSWYKNYHVRIAKVEKEYKFESK